MNIDFYDNYTCDICARKALGRVPHRPLMDKLADMAINPSLFRWLWDYLSGRSQCVIVNGESSPVEVISGVPQGSVLGPHLILVYISGVATIPLNNGMLLLYADDILCRYAGPE